MARMGLDKSETGRQHLTVPSFLHWRMNFLIAFARILELNSQIP